MIDFTALLTQHNYFKGTRIESLRRIDENTLAFNIIIDNDDGEPITLVTFTFSDVYDARLLDNSVLPFIDMMSGITLLTENGRSAFCVGQHDAMLHIQSAPFFIICDAITFEEKAL